jgi:hypothetical protein
MKKTYYNIIKSFAACTGRVRCHSSKTSSKALKNEHCKGNQMHIVMKKREGEIISICSISKRAWFIITVNDQSNLIAEDQRYEVDQFKYHLS